MSGSDPVDPGCEQILARARKWMQDDPDPATREELGRLIEAGDLEELRERMGEELGFGTAGLRGKVGAGSARMNRAVVARVTYGLGQYLLEQPELHGRPVVVGYDARRPSAGLAEDAAGVLVALGVPVRFFAEPIPTPLVAYATRRLGAAAGVMITASHNPPEYSGYKVYGRDGIQVGPPADQSIASRAQAAPAACTIARAEQVFSRPSSGATAIGAELFEQYLGELDRVRPRIEGDRSQRIAVTALHGVGWRKLEAALRRAGYGELFVVEEQAEPDPDFPTVSVPNPEEPEALERVERLGEQVGAQLALALDPDADRLAVCVPGSDGRIRALSGNQVGVLLGDFILRHAPSEPRPLVVSTVVSSPMLEAIAAAYGARYERTLTGFRWVCRAGLELERTEKLGFVFGYEEACGYALSPVRDKDGIGAAIIFADLGAWCLGRGLQIRDHLHLLYREHGLWVSAADSVPLLGQRTRLEVTRAMDRLAHNPPIELVGHRVLRRIDYRQGAQERPAWLAASNLVELELDQGARVCVRPSGTEPKLKVYVDLRVSPGKEDDLEACESRATERARKISRSLLHWLGLS